MTDRPTPNEKPTAAEVIDGAHTCASEDILTALADEGYEVVAFKEASIAVGEVIDQRNRAVQALAELSNEYDRLADRAHAARAAVLEMPLILAKQVLDEDWAQAVLDGE